MPKKAQARRTSRRASEESAKEPAASCAAPSTVVERAETAPAARAPATSTWKSYYSLIPVALGLLASANSLWNGYAIDDITQVRNNALIRELKNIPKAFTNSVWSFASNEIVFTADRYFRPLFNVLLTINYAIFGTAPWGWHLANILIHAAATYLVFLVIDQVTGSKAASMITAGLFAVHPVHAESIAWVSGVTDPLMSLFALSAFYLYLRYKRSRNLVLLAGMMLLYLLGAMTKETALALPLACGLYGGLPF
jgi:4-amino-4-deoxy-L-arabinose transferase-like glycosyltransferase